MSEQPRCREQLEREKLELEVDILKLEKRHLETKQPPLGHGWEKTRTGLGFLGWIIAAFSLIFSVGQYNDQQQLALDQRIEEQTEGALAKIQEDPLRLALYLDNYAEQATPLLVELIHVRHEEEGWPLKPLRALRSIAEVGVALDARQLDLLREEARRGWRRLEGWIGTEPQKRPIGQMKGMDEVLYGIYILVGTDDSSDEDRKWQVYDQNGRLASVPGFVE